MRIFRAQVLVRLVAILAIAFSAAPLSARDAQTLKPSEIDGIWVGESMVRDGKARKLELGEVRFTFRGSTMLAVGLAGPREMELKYTIDPSTSPKQLDYGLPDGPAVKAIYSIEGSVLTVAIPKPGGGRPTSLISAEGSGLTVFKLTRSTRGGR